MSWYKQQSKGWQKGWNDQFGDLQRYMYDAYECGVYITKLENRQITVSAVLQHYHFGIVVFQEFWRFPVTAVDAAKACYEQVKKAVGDVFEEFRTNTIPNNLIHSYLREALRDVTPEAKPKSRIPWVDWARDKAGVSDWRSSIYGNRYPTTEIDGF